MKIFVITEVSGKSWGEFHIIIIKDAPNCKMMAFFLAKLSKQNSTCIDVNEKKVL